jgi:chemotaxis methyl-accepting protein methylase/mannose-6-phosphate isomerase-like protein (cupin superfamily)
MFKRICHHGTPHAVGMNAMQYVYSRPTVPSFDGKGLFGYTFGPLKQKDLEFYYIAVEKGHDTFMVSKQITRTYYVVSGSGYFTIDNCRHKVAPGMLIEVPPKVEYSYSGKMELIALSRPRWFSGNDSHTKWNPDVLQGYFPCAADSKSWLARLVKLTIFGKSPTNAFLRFNRRLWNLLPASLIALGPVRSYGDFLHMLVRLQSVRGQLQHTFFLRNRPTLDLVRRLVEKWDKRSVLRVAVLGCSAGAEAYSVAWSIRAARPDLQLSLQGVDISRQAIVVAKDGVYSPAVSEITGTDVFDRMTEAEIEQIFDRDGDALVVKSWIKDGIEWRIGDVRDSAVRGLLGSQDIVVANNFLCHMDAWAAEGCLRNIGDLVKPGGYLFVSGVDLEVRTKVAEQLGWQPLQELLEEIHYGDPRMGGGWPWNYSSLEPLNRKRKDWRLRYAAAFRLPFASERSEIFQDDSPGGYAETSAVAKMSLVSQ